MVLRTISQLRNHQCPWSVLIAACLTPCKCPSGPFPALGDGVGDAAAIWPP